MIRIVPSGDIGFDVLLGGGWRLVTRLPERSSATVVVRGGAGAGKTLVGLEIALKLAEAQQGDVAVGCVEILPSEYVAQVRSARPDVNESRVFPLPLEKAAPPEDSGPRVFCALLAETESASHDLVANLEALDEEVRRAGGRPVVFIIDSLIEGYGIGSNAPRTDADAVMKFAAQMGCCVVLCEEVTSGSASPWVFAADTVLELGVEARERGRWVEVRKHRFGASASGKHELDIGDGRRPKVYPEAHAWVARSQRAVLRAYGWRYSQEIQIPSLAWRNSPHETLKGEFVFIRSKTAGLAKALALTLAVDGKDSCLDLIFELDPLVMDSTETGLDNHYVHRILPAVRGPARTLCTLVHAFGRLLSVSQEGNRLNPTRLRRIVIGDVGPWMDQIEWVHAIRTFAILVADAGWGIPIIAYDGLDQSGGSEILSGFADIRIRATPSGMGWDKSTSIWAHERSARASKQITLDGVPSDPPLSASLAFFDHLYRPRLTHEGDP